MKLDNLQVIKDIVWDRVRELSEKSLRAEIGSVEYFEFRRDSDLAEVQWNTLRAESYRMRGAETDAEICELEAQISGLKAQRSQKRLDDLAE